ncbi:MAG: galactokinase [Prevotellaceae bacterium]|jgi:galactokinase|nr:galactokinase [Prevotellaceae bacterium]
MDLKALKKSFADHLFGTPDGIYTAPGRVNLIGEHTDYNGGFVLPGAIDKGITLAIKATGYNTIRVADRIHAFSMDYIEFSEMRLTQTNLPGQSWAKYIFGVVREFEKRGIEEVKGFDVVFYGDVPLGAGLSSSAALESAFAFALNDLYGYGFDKFELAKIGQATEHNYVGVKCGIMDQFASLFGKQGNLIRLDCRSLEHQYMPFNPVGYKLVLLDSRVKHELVNNPYNRRRESCEAAAAAIRKRHPEVEFLRDANFAMLEEVKTEISAEDYSRAKFVIGEVQRLLDVCDALNKDDYKTVGQKMYETHAGLSKLYEVSCEELDFLNDVAKKYGVTGSRIMGGGFGGCTINLVEESKYEAFIAGAVADYKTKFGIDAKVYDVVISDGARRIE